MTTSSKCPTCGGEKVLHNAEGHAIYDDCSECQLDVCPDCHGTGLAPDQVLETGAKCVCTCHRPQQTCRQCLYEHGPDPQQAGELELRERTPEERVQYYFDKIKDGSIGVVNLQLYIATEIDRAVAEARKQTASDILNLANEYAGQDETMHGAESIRNYHCFNAINKIGGFDGR